MCRDALQRNESCGGNFRIEPQTEEGEAKYNDKKIAYVGVWEDQDPNQKPKLHKEPLEFSEVQFSPRSYK